MSSRTCRICKQRPARLCDSCGPHQSAPELKQKPDVGLRKSEKEAGRMIAAIDSALPPGWGAVLLIASHGSKGFSTYASTLDRSSVPTLLRESAAQIEEGSDRPPGRLGAEN